MSYTVKYSLVLLYPYATPCTDVPNYTSIFVKFALYAVTIFVGMIVADYLFDENIDYYMIDAYDRIVFRFRNIGYLGLGAGMSFLNCFAYVSV